eukprot:1698552-Prymnesium_polylepis.1
MPGEGYDAWKAMMPGGRPGIMTPRAMMPEPTFWNGRDARIGRDAHSLDPGNGLVLEHECCAC